MQSGALPPCQVPNAESQALPPQALPRLELHKHIARPCPHIDGFPFVKRANRAAAFGMRDHASPTPQSILERLNAKARARKEAEAGQTRNGNGSGDAARQCPEDKERAESNARAGSSSHDVPRSGAVWQRRPLEKTVVLEHAALNKVRCLCAGVGADERGSKRRRGLAEKGTSTKKARETAGAVDSPPDEAPAGNGDALGPEVDAGEAAVDVDGANGADEDREMSGEDDGGDGTVASLRGTNVTLPQGKKARKAPVLPWMRVPMSVGQGADDETLEDVAGLRQVKRGKLFRPSPRTCTRALSQTACPSPCRMSERLFARLASSPCFRSRLRFGSTWLGAPARGTICACAPRQGAARRWPTRCL